MWLFWNEWCQHINNDTISSARIAHIQEQHACNFSTLHISACVQCQYWGYWFSTLIWHTFSHVTVLLSNLIFVGDFNNNFYNNHHPLFHKLDDIMSTFSLTQIVKDPTHVNQSGADTLLHLVLVSSQNHVESCEVIPPLANSDCSSGNGKKHLWSKPRTIWRYNLANFEMVCNLLSNVN